MAEISFRDSRIVIVGAGLTGYTAAAALSQAGCTNIVIYDARADPTMFESDRAYSLVIYQNGQRVLQQLHGFDELFKKDAVCQHVRVVNQIDANGNNTVETSIPPSGPVYWLLKRRMLQLLDSYVRTRYPNVKIVTKARVNDASFGKDGTSLTVTHGDGSEERVAVDLLLACDGSKSTIRALMAKHDDEVKSKRGMQLYSRRSAATGIRHKGLELDEMPIISSPGAATQLAQPSEIYYLLGDRRQRSAQRVFDMMLLPVCSGKGEPRRAALSVRAGHALLSVNSVEEAFALFVENFPQLRVHDLISERSMQQFVDTEAAEFPPVERPNSLVAHFSSGHGGVMFVGDSAHSFPPDAAQGVNSAMQDVEALLRIASHLPSDAPPSALLSAYETARDSESWDLIHLSETSSTATYAHSGVVARARFALNKRVRAVLAAVMPGVCAAEADTLLRQGLSYATVRRRDARTGAVMATLGSALLLAVPCALARVALSTRGVECARR
eukprot:TRINITY_DN1999_c0_g1_i1.p1 TRINITY_DN1999_c0_g1~~TRINITY_DN1999_c0_g1_i1.p1  ORF type:complete len:499 (-),score=104.94 TRINITY_DN1999_c0_g1_i1:2360-3856(-)